MTFAGSLAVFSKVVSFVLEEPAGLTLEEHAGLILEELGAGLLGVGKDRL